MKWFSLIIMLLSLLTACTEKPLEAQRRSRDEKIVQTLWSSATKVSSSEEIVGTWMSEKGDLPKGFNVKSYTMSFGRGGGLSINQETKAGTIGLPFEYQIKQSKLYVATAGPPFSEWGELRRYKMLLLKKSKDSITVFRGGNKK